jgi:hypothetical protein
MVMMRGPAGDTVETVNSTSTEEAALLDPLSNPTVTDTGPGFDHQETLGH